MTVLWILELLGDTLYTRKVIELRKMSKPDQEAVMWPWVNHMARTCQDYTGLGIGWGDDAKKRYGSYRYECVTFTGFVKEQLAYPVRGKMEDRKLRIPFSGEVRADLRAVTKETTPSGNIRFTAERSENGHADRFWALALAVQAAGTAAGRPWAASRGARQSQQILKGLLGEKFDTLPNDISRAWMKEHAAGPAFARFIEGKIPGEFPVAVLQTSVQAARKLDTQTIWLSQETLQGFSGDLTMDDYRQLPALIDNDAAVAKQYRATLAGNKLTAFKKVKN